MFVSDAYADAPTVSPTTASTTTPAVSPAVTDAPPSPFSGMGILLLIPVMLYLLMIRPNQRKIKEYETMVKGLRKGDRVVTGGGIIGIIQKIENDEVLVVEIAPDVKVRVMRETISNIVTKTAVNDNKADDKTPKKSEG